MHKSLHGFQLRVCRNPCAALSSACAQLRQTQQAANSSVKQSSLPSSRNVKRCWKKKTLHLPTLLSSSQLLTTADLEMQHNVVLLNPGFTFVPSCSLGAGLMFSQHQRTKIPNFHRHTHPTLTLEAEVVMMPSIKVLFHKLTALQCWIVCQVTGYQCPSVTHVHRHAQEHRATCGYPFKSSLIPSLLSASQNDLAYPVFPQTE